MSTPTPEHAARMAAVREGLLTKAIAKANSHAALIGVALTPDQAEEAGRRILKSEQAARAAEARALLAVKRAEREQTWAIEQAKAYATRYLDLWGARTTESERRSILRHMLDVASAECLSPDGFKAGRLLRRLGLALNEAKAMAANTTSRLNGTLVEQPDWDALPTLDDIAAEDGIAPWADR